MDNRFHVQTEWDRDYMGEGFPPVVGWAIRDKRNEEDVFIEGRRLLFNDQEHAEIFARVMNFGNNLKD